MEDDEDYSRYIGLINNCDPGAPLLSQTKLGACLSQIRLECLPPAELNRLTLALSVEQLVRLGSGLARDYRGLAELMGFSLAEIETRFKKSNNPAKSLIDAYYIYRSSSQHDNGSRNRFISVTDLLKVIEQIERFDVIDDLLPALVKLASQKTATTTIEITNSSDCSESPRAKQQVQDIDRLTFDDTHQNATNYDAYISYAPQDINEAQDLKSELQNRGLKVATADDLLPGHFEYDALMRLIDLRCRKVIIIMTVNYCRSEECKFELRFASEVAIKGNDRKIIPVIYGRIPEDEIPGMLGYTSKINLYNPINGRAQQFERLIRSLDCHHTPPPHLPVCNNNGFLDVQSTNRRTSSFNGPLCVESASTSYTNGIYDHSFSNGASPIASRNNHPVIELAHSQDSSAIARNRSPRGPARLNGRTLDTNSNSTVESPSASSRATPTPDKKKPTTIHLVTALFKNTFSSKKRGDFGINDSSSAFASRSRLLISKDSSDLSTDETDVECRKASSGLVATAALPKPRS